MTKNGIGYTRRFLRLCLKCDEKEKVTDIWVITPSFVHNSVSMPSLSKVTKHEKLTDAEFHREICLAYEKSSEG